MKISSLFATLAVCVAVTCNAATLRFDFGNIGQQVPTNYNSIGPAQDPILNAIDISGAGTGIGLASTGFNSLGDNQAGTQTPTGAAAIFDPLATRDSLFGHDSNFNIGSPRPLATLTFSGLDGSGATNYEFTFFASRTGVSDNRETKYSVAGANNGVGFLNVANNTSNVAIVSGIVPTAGGVVTINIEKGPNNSNGDKFFYLGAMQLVSAAVPEPTTCGLLALSSLGLLFRRRFV